MRILASSWPEDFFTKLIAGLPSEFHDKNSPTIRGTYSDKIKLTCMKRRSKDPQIETFDFLLADKPVPTDAGVADFLNDVRKIAKQNGLTEVKNPSQLDGGAFLLGRIEGGFRLLVSEL